MLEVMGNIQYTKIWKENLQRKSNTAVYAYTFLNRIIPFNLVRSENNALNIDM